MYCLYAFGPHSPKKYLILTPDISVLLNIILFSNSVSLDISLNPGSESEFPSLPTITSFPRSLHIINFKFKRL